MEREQMDSATVRAKHKEFLFPCVANYYEEPIVLTAGQGCCVRDADGLTSARMKTHLGGRSVRATGLTGA